MKLSAPATAVYVFRALEDLVKHTRPGNLPVKHHHTLSELGLDSLDLVEALTLLSLDLSVDLDNNELSPESTVQDVVNFVLERAGFAPGASQAI